MKKRYPQESAGARREINVPTCKVSDRVSQVKEAIFNAQPPFETINYIYVLDDEKLVGVFSIKEIFKRKDEEQVSDFMARQLIKASPLDDQEKIVISAIKNNLKAIPLVEEDDRFLGVVSSDNIIDILHEEHVEDLFVSSGFTKKDDFSDKIIEMPASILAKIRIPWLVVGLLGGVIAAQITTLFESHLKVHFILAAFIPLIVYMADAVGAQTQTLYIRNLAIKKFSHKRYIIKELKTGLLMALVLASIIFLTSFLMSRDPLIGVILSVSLFLTIISAILISVTTVQTLFKLGRDPALGSGPFGTIIADIASLIVYFSVATILLSLFAS